MVDCICIQDESRDWINCPVHGEKIREDRIHNAKIAQQIAELATQRHEWASKNNWPIVGGPITTYITMYQCPKCLALVLLPEQHNDWHRWNKA